jgi:hypothetical protein
MLSKSDRVPIGESTIREGSQDANGEYTTNSAYIMMHRDRLHAQFQS